MTDGDWPAITPGEVARRRTALEQAEYSGETEGQDSDPVMANGRLPSG